MAGGMSAGRGETLAERVANTRARQEQDAPMARLEHAAEPPSPTAGSPVSSHSTAGFHSHRPTAPTSGVPPQAKHCWYHGSYGRQAALLVRWRQVGGGYDGLILVPVQDDGGWVLAEMWVESSMLRPA